MIRRTLARIGCSVKTVSPGADFLRSVRGSKPELIILGTMRRQLERGVFCRLLKDDAQAGSIPVVALLGSDPTTEQWDQ
ncbi:MAG: hypothetical protein ACE5NC_07315, partial [Anaerolineae bacterium]